MIIGVIGVAGSGKPDAIVVDVSQRFDAIVQRTTRRHSYADFDAAFQHRGADEMTVGVEWANHSWGANVKPEMGVFRDLDDLSLRAAEAAVTTITGAVRATGKCSLVLSGGHTPRTFYGLLASRFRDQIPWTHVHVFWGDERYVPPDDPQSNYRMAREALLDHVPCPTANVHPMPTHSSIPDGAAREYEATLKSFFAGDAPQFDLVLLGLGPEGHTASLFPGSPALDERTRWVLAVTAPAEPPVRLTLTLPAFTRAVHTYFLVTGANKSQALHHVLSGTADPNAYPAAGVQPRHGAVTWWVDQDAAAQPHDEYIHSGGIFNV